MNTIGIVLAIALATITWLYFMKKRNRVYKLLSEIPGPKPTPLIGTPIPILFMNKVELFQQPGKIVKTYGPISHMWFGNIPSVQLADPKYIELVLSNTDHITKGFGYKFFWPWLGNGLLTSTGERWHRHRKLLTPTFHFQILETFMDVFVEKSELLVKVLEKEANGQPFNIFPYMTRCALDIVCETAMGIQVNALSRENWTYVEAINGICQEIVHRITKFWLQLDWLYYKTKHGKKFLQHLSVLHDTTYKLIKQGKMVLAQKENFKDDSISENNFYKKKRKAFLDLLLDLSKNGKVLTDTQIREEVDTFLFEGYDTTTASLSWTIFLLGLHPDIQERAYEEVSRVLGDDQPLTFAELNDLKYLEQVIKESLRLYPSVPLISRIASEDIKIDKYTVPAGTSIAIFIYDLHRNPEYFPEPNKFDPDRFSSENVKDRHPYAYIPFSAGPRNCIGQKFAMCEEKTVLSYIIKNFKIKSMQTVESVTPINDLILIPHKEISITLERRI